MKLQIYSVNNRYSFAIGKFSSLSHFYLCPYIKPSYQYAWEAYRDAKNILRFQPSHIDVLNRTAEDDLKISDMAVSSEISAEDMIVGHYSRLLEIMTNRMKSFKDEKEKEVAYGEIKAVVGGLLKVKETLESDTDKGKLEGILDDFRRIVQDKFSKLLEKDKVEMEKKENEPAPEAPPVPSIDEIAGDPSMDSMGGVSGVDPQSPPILPTAQVDAIMKYSSKESNLDDIRSDVLDEYAERICKAIEKKHPDAICKINYEDGTLKVSKDGDKKILRVFINKDLHIEDIEPETEISTAFPLHSIEFYQKYWKPIVESVGHCLIKSLGVLICPEKSSLPNIPNSFPSTTKLKGWNVKNSSEQSFELCFEGDSPTWKIKNGTKDADDKNTKEANRKINPSKYTEEDFIHGQPKRVECIDPNLKSIYGKIGEVVQVIPLQDHIECDVNFGRLVVRLTENQIELIDEIQNNT